MVTEIVGPSLSSILLFFERKSLVHVIYYRVFWSILPVVVFITNTVSIVDLLPRTALTPRGYIYDHIFFCSELCVNGSLLSTVSIIVFALTCE